MKKGIELVFLMLLLATCGGGGGGTNGGDSGANEDFCIDGTYFLEVTSNECSFYVFNPIIITQEGCSVELSNFGGSNPSGEVDRNSENGTVRVTFINKYGDSAEWECTLVRSQYTGTEGTYSGIFCKIVGSDDPYCWIDCIASP